MTISKKSYNASHLKTFPFPAIERLRRPFLLRRTLFREPQKLKKPARPRERPINRRRLAVRREKEKKNVSEFLSKTDEFSHGFSVFYLYASTLRGARELSTYHKQRVSD
jgi:hypothetical protein